MQNVPVKFFDAYMEGDDTRFIELQHSQMTWSVKVIMYRDIKRPHCKLTKGITRFFRDNKIKEGDACVFEAINFDPDTLKVLVFHN